MKKEKEKKGKKKGGGKEGEGERERPRVIATPRNFLPRLHYPALLLSNSRPRGEPYEGTLRGEKGGGRGGKGKFSSP